MTHRFTCCVAALICLLAARASALVVEQSVTPASVKAKDSRFSVKAEMDKDGLIQFTITYRLPRPQYLLAHFELRDGETLLARTDSPVIVHEDSATYHVAVSPKHLAGAKFVLSENALDTSGTQALPGGTIFNIDLPAFGKDAPAAKAD